jgi:hypothetical protein
MHESELMQEHTHAHTHTHTYLRSLTIIIKLCGLVLVSNFLKNLLCASSSACVNIYTCIPHRVNDALGRWNIAHVTSTCHVQSTRWNVRIPSHMTNSCRPGTQTHRRESRLNYVYLLISRTEVSMENQSLAPCLHNAVMSTLASTPRGSLCSHTGQIPVLARYQVSLPHG